MRGVVLALGLLCHGVCVEARTSSSSPVVNRSSEDLEVSIELDGSPVLSARLAPFARTSLWAVCYGEDGDMAKRLTTRVGQDADRLLKDVSATGARLLYSLPRDESHFNPGKLWDTRSDAITKVGRHLDSLPTGVGDWHTFDAVFLSLRDFSELSPRQRESVAQAIHLGLNLDLVGTVDVASKKTLEALFGPSFAGSWDDASVALPYTEYRAGLGRVRVFAIDTFSLRADSAIIPILGQVDPQPIHDVKRWLRNNHRVDDAERLPMGPFVWLWLCTLAFGLIWVRGHWVRLVCLLTAWVVCGALIEPTQDKFEGLGASSLRLPISPGEWVDVTMLTAKVSSGRTEFVPSDGQGMIGLSTL